MTGGIPLIYLGDEIGTLNDYSYREDPAHQQESHWAHRPRANWEHYTKRNDPHTTKGRVFIGLKNLIELRKRYEVFSGGELEIIPTENEYVLRFTRPHGADCALIFADFSGASQMILSPLLETQPIKAESLIHGTSNL
jgi:hypothetical protein